MAIFVLNENAAPEFDYLPEMVPTSSALNEATLEFAQEMYKLSAGLYVADILIEEKAVYEGVDPTVLMEGSIKDFIANAKKKIEELWKKVKAWFKSVFENIKARLMSGKKFISTYKDQLITKIGEVGNKFTFKGYEYISGELKSAVKASDACISKAKEIETAVNRAKVIGVRDDKNGILNSSSSEIIEDMIQSFDSKSMTIKDLKGVFTKEFRGGSTDKEQDLTLDAVKVKIMINNIESAKDDVKSLKDLEKKADDMFKAISQTIKSLENQISASGKVDNAGTLVNKAVSAAQACIHLHNQICGISKDLYNERYSHHLRVLRQLLAFRPKKESFDWGFGSDDSDKSILESAMSLL